MDIIGESWYTNGRVDDATDGTAHSGHHERANAQEVVMNVPPPPRRGDAPPDLRPDGNGLGRGDGAVSAYPERDLNPHPAVQEGILSHFGPGSASVQNGRDRGENGSGNGHERDESVPNEGRPSPDESPDLGTRVTCCGAYSFAAGCRCVEAAA